MAGSEAFVSQLGRAREYQEWRGVEGGEGRMRREGEKGVWGVRAVCCAPYISAHT